MKNKILTLIAIGLLGFTLAGCDNNSTYTEPNSTGNNQNSEKISRTPSLIEVVNTFKNNNPSLMVNGLKEAVGKLSSVKLTDGINFFLKIKDIYSKNPVKDGQNVYTNISQMALLSTYTYESEENDPILIIKNATLKDSYGSSKVNVVLLGGTELKSGQATGLLSDLYSGMELSNEYLYDAYYAIYNNLKGEENTPLIIGGVSLGGMVAQQLAALPALNEYFKVKNVVAIASPILSPDKIDYNITTVRRMVDTVDLVPKLSISYDGGYVSAYGDKNAPVVKTSTYKTFIGSHTLGYVDNTVWANVDVLGYENGKATLTFTSADMTRYPAYTYKSSK